MGGKLRRALKRSRAYIKGLQQSASLHQSMIQAKPVSPGSELENQQDGGREVHTEPQQSEYKPSCISSSLACNMRAIRSRVQQCQSVQLTYGQEDCSTTHPGFGVHQRRGASN